MTESLHIKNFGPIKDIRLDDIRPLTVLIGESAGGKSTIMKVLVLFRWIFKMCNLRGFKGEKPEGFPEKISDLLPNTDLDAFAREGSEISYKVSFDDHRTFAINWTHGRELSFTGQIIQTDLRYLKLSFIAETRGLVPNVAAKPQLPRGADFGFFFHETFNDFGESTLEVRKFTFFEGKAEYRIEKSGLVNKYLVRSLDPELPYEIELHQTSSGMQNTVPLLSIAKHFALKFDPPKALNKKIGNGYHENDRAKPEHLVSLHIEEPELGLFPDVQCDLLNILAKDCFIDSKNNMRIIMATHSPYILNHLNLLIKSHDTDNTEFTDGAKLSFDDIAVYHVTDGKIEDLKRLTGKRLIDTDVLSDPINDIYDRYEELEK